MLGPDFRYAGVDGRLALARLLALQGRHEEATACFRDARAVLDEQGARPVRAICDHDEALMHLRRCRVADAGRARSLLDAAGAQFDDLAMTGWMRRAENLSSRMG
ncbi:MAG: hypothetical protein ACRDYV_01660 [Acidimicrobiia bacterium]